MKSLTNYSGAKKESRFLLFLYLVIVSALTLALFILCGFAFKVSTDEDFLIKVWEQMPYDKQRQMAAEIGVDLPEDEGEAAEKLTNAREKVLNMTKGNFKRIGGVAVGTAFILVSSI